MTKLGQAKLASFLNDPANGIPVEVLGREPNRYCKRVSHNIGRVLKTGGDRYVIFNTENRQTVEVRLGEATLDPEQFFSRVELVHALVMWVRQSAISGLSDGHFASWVMATPRGQYPHLKNTLSCLKGIEVRETSQMGNPYKRIDYDKRLREELVAAGCSITLEELQSGVLPPLPERYTPTTLAEGGPQSGHRYITSVRLVASQLQQRFPHLRLVEVGGHPRGIRLTLVTVTGHALLQEQASIDACCIEKLATDLALTALSESGYCAPPGEDRQWFLGTDLYPPVLRHLEGVERVGRYHFRLMTCRGSYVIALDLRYKKAREYLAALQATALANRQRVAA
jgi:hypothetical protein